MCSPFKIDDSVDGEKTSPLNIVSGGIEQSSFFGWIKLWANLAMSSVSEI